MGKKILPLILLVLVLSGVGYGVFRSHGAIEGHTATTKAVLPLSGAIGSEKAPLLADPAVVSTLADAGFSVRADKVGSREIVTGFKDGAYAFGWPSGAPAAAELKARSHAEGETTPFYTPMVIATWKPIADILEANGIVSGAGQTRRVDMHKLADLMLAGKRWNELQHSEAYPVGKTVLVTSTDVRRSNSAAMYLALLSYVENGDQVIDDKAAAQAMAEKLAPLFLRQGFQEESSADPFADYAAMGMGKTPLLIAYESQAVEYLLDPAAGRRDQIVLLYPSPTILSKNVFVPYGADARRLGQTLTDAPAIHDAAHRYGYRLPSDSAVPQAWRKAGVSAPDTLIDVIDPPSFAMLETMIAVIQGKLQ